jgi:Fe-S cluster assembly protein SufD
LDDRSLWNGRKLKTMSPTQSYRSEALEKFSALLPIPKSSDEFKYTSLDGFSFQKHASDFASKLVDLKDSGDLYPGTKVVRLSSSSSEIEISGNFDAKQVSVMTWSMLQKSDPELFSKAMQVPSRLEKDAYAQWIAAHASHGIFIKVAKNTKVDETIQIIHRLDSSLMNHRVCVWLEDGATCSVLEEYRAVDVNFETNTVPVQVSSLAYGYAGVGAKLKWTQVQALPHSVSSVMRAQIDANQDAECSGAFLSLGSSVAHYHLEFNAKGAYSNLDFICAYLGTHDRHCDFFVRNSHPAKNSSCDTKILNVVAQESTAVFNGMIEIPQNAPKVDAAHRAKSLVLSPKARVQANPKLEIATDDVKCAHGASISSIDPAQLYYLQSRGISRFDAESMIVDSFLNPALDRINVDGVRSHYKGLVVRSRELLGASLGVKEG